MKFLTKIVSSVAVIALSGALQAMPKGWTTDFPKALEQAKKENKLLLVDFTGSDWCGWCVKLDKEVFSQDAFAKAVFNQYVPVYIDFPQDKSKMSAELMAQNKDLAAKYKINGYPTILLLDSEGEIVARTGYKKGGPEVYLTHLKELQEKTKREKELFAKAAKLSGVERIKALDKIISDLPMNEQADHMKLMKEIMAGDKDNKLGLQSKYAFTVIVQPAVMDFHQGLRTKNTPIFKQLDALKADPDKKDEFTALLEKFKKSLAIEVEPLINKLNEFDKKYQFTGLTRQRYLSVLVNCYRMQRKADKALEVAKEAVKIDPTTRDANSLNFMINQLSKDVPEKTESTK